MRIIALLVIGTTLSGCSGMMVSGGAAGVSGSAPIGKQGSGSSQPSDSQIRRNIERQFNYDSLVSQGDVDVRSSRGMVTLSGTVPTYSARERAERLAISVDGVKGIDNEIIVRQVRTQ